MRKYTLASPEARQHIDLQDYQDVIIDAVHEFVPAASVRVEADCYYVDPEPPQGSAIKIGRKICQSDLKQYCVQIPKLFSSIKLEGEDHGEEKQKPAGGHQ